MTRQQANMTILRYLQKRIQQYPDIRFKQLLIDLKLSPDSHNAFNEESVTTLKKMNKGDEIIVPCKNNSDELLLCRCSSTEHQMLVRILDDVYVEVHLAPLSLKERIKHAIKYVLGFRSKFGDFEEFILQPSDADRLQGIVDYLRTVK